MSKTPVKARKKTTAAAKAPKATKKPSRAKATKAQGTTAVERHRMIAQAAYRLAVKHGVGNRNPLRDWLEAEAEVDARLAAKNQKRTSKKSASSAKKSAKKAVTSVKKASSSSKKKTAAKRK